MYLDKRYISLNIRRFTPSFFYVKIIVIFLMIPKKVLLKYINSFILYKNNTLKLNVCKITNIRRFKALTCVKV